VLHKYTNQFGGGTLSRIGKLFGRDHSTVIHGCEAVNDWLDYPDIFTEDLERLKTIETKFRNHFADTSTAKEIAEETRLTIEN
jgi:hypothetical protein